MATRERNGFGVPGWAVFMTQNLDRPFSVALKSAMEHARELGAREIGEPLRQHR